MSAKRGSKKWPQRLTDAQSKTVCAGKGICPERVEGENEMTIETKDLWQGAYLLSEGGCLSDVEVCRRYDGKQEIVFVFDGEKIEELMRKFQSGQALCNVSRLKASVNHLRDLIFKR